MPNRISFFQNTIAAGSRPVSVATGDFNSDGLADLVVANSSDNQVAVRLGTGTGGFGNPTTFATGTRPIAIAVSDFDGGQPDLVIANRNQNSVSVLLGNGGGAFGAQATYGVGSEPAAIAIGEFTGDGQPDLAVINQEDNSVSLLMGSSGSFVTFSTIPDTGTTPSAIAVADFNGDGRDDLAITHFSDDNVVVRLGNRSGGFIAQPSSFAVGSAPRAIATGDFNGDGAADLAIANSRANSVSVLLGNGSGSFAAQQTIATGRSPRSIAVADFNGDGKRDLAVANRNGNSLSVLLNQAVITRVNQITPDGTYGVGSTIEFSITFDKAVTVNTASGTPTIALNSGSNGSSVTASYHRISPDSKTLTFRYVVAAEQGTPDLDFASANSLVLNGGSISDAQGTPVHLALPTPATPGSLGAIAAIRIFTVSPAAPTFTSLSPDSGTAGDGITNATSVTLSGQAISGGTVRILRNGTEVGTAPVSQAGEWSFAAGNLSETTHSFTATVTDTAGNRSSQSPNYAVTIDRTAPDAPEITGFSPDNGQTGDRLTNQSQITLTGTAAAGSQVKIFDGATVLGSGTANQNGEWSILTNSLADRRYDLTATATDAAGNGSARSASFNVTIDTSVPAAPTIDQFSPNSGLPDDNITNSDSITLSGSAPDGLQVALFKDNMRIATITPDRLGDWSHPVTNLTDGLHAFSARTVNSAGTLSTPDRLSVRIDSTAPTINRMELPADEIYQLGQTLSFSVIFSEAVAINSGSGSVAIPITLNQGGTVSAVLTSSGDLETEHTFEYTVARNQLDFDGIALGSDLVLTGNAQITDRAGNRQTNFRLGNPGSTSNILVDGSFAPTPVPRPTPVPPPDPTPRPTPPPDPIVSDESSAFGVATPVPKFRATNGILRRTDRPGRLVGSPKNDRLIGSNRNDTLQGKRGDDVLVGRGGDDRLFANGGNDRLFGSSGNDELQGHFGRELLLGGSGNDLLMGRQGDDLLVGGTGQDRLMGGVGRDLFIYRSTNEGDDRIIGFQAGDAIDLRNIFASAAFQTGTSLLDRFRQFVRLVPTSNGTQVTIDQDGKGSGTAFVPLATLQNVSLNEFGQQNLIVQ